MANAQRNPDTLGNPSLHIGAYFSLSQEPTFYCGDNLAQAGWSGSLGFMVSSQIARISIGAIRVNSSGTFANQNPIRGDQPAAQLPL